MGLKVVLRDIERAIRDIEGVRRGVKGLIRGIIFCDNFS